ncbi:spore coat protein [Alicyclobacillus fastidiosus]|uniref:Spore coat protein n=1 Tax=Alicyclobacillus fastidiosus TaxID=392011 RepID=A0ABY6ZGC8_9BACL|nr:spore coat protein [Alicyclobacillus fastidiosus]WAH41912.1 spore coat protein [Alicyclobacillus fastidiosus]GMA63627.1 hypothetical protein GCM10025859_40670 [Alicyclobacillus fastidiosus]
MSSQSKKRRKRHDELSTDKRRDAKKSHHRRHRGGLSFGYDYDIDKSEGLYLPKKYLTGRSCGLPVDHLRGRGDDSEDLMCTAEAKTVESTVFESAELVEWTDEESYIVIVVRDSCDVEIVNQDFMAALNLQFSLQLALATVLSVTVASHETASSIVQDIVSRMTDVQRLRRVIQVENSKSVKVHISSAEVAFNIQILLQFLLALINQVEVA